MIEDGRCTHMVVFQFFYVSSALGKIFCKFVDAFIDVCLTNIFCFSRCRSCWLHTSKQSHACMVSKDKFVRIWFLPIWFRFAAQPSYVSVRCACVDIVWETHEALHIDSKFMANISCYRRLDLSCGSFREPWTLNCKGVIRMLAYIRTSRNYSVVRMFIPVKLFLSPTTNIRTHMYIRGGAHTCLIYTQPNS